MPTITPRAAKHRNGHSVACLLVYSLAAYFAAEFGICILVVYHILEAFNFT